MDMELLEQRRRNVREDMEGRWREGWFSEEGREDRGLGEEAAGGERAGDSGDVVG